MKKTLSALENTIISMIGNDPFKNLCKNPAIYTPLKTLLAERCRVLNEMFVPTDSNMRQFIRVNNHLYTQTQKLYRRVNQMQDQRSLINDPDFDDDYELEGRLSIPFNGDDSILALPDDDYYGSNFSLMIDCLAAVYSEPVLHVIPGQIPLDNSTSWDEGPFQKHPQFKDITICYAVHDICTHRPYSIPDLLRLNDFWCEVQLTVQNITRQDGLRS